ncbi:MAG TPA: YCF48-related protein [Rubricoccaceae bacterium]|nr:YCF48-related protein [Rubricoccaceae bacterium]
MSASATLWAARRAAPLTLLLALAPTAGAQWVQQSPIPHGNYLHDVGSPTPGVAFIAGDDSEWDDPRGPLFVTTDGGQTWADVPLPNQFGLYDIFFLNSQLGWTVGDENWRTTDGGQTWQPMQFLGSTYYVEFFTPTFGYAVSNGGIYVSRNGGASWNFSPGESYAFSFRDDNQVGIAGGPQGIRRTTNGGQSFSMVRSGEAYDVAFLSDDVAVAIIDNQVARSADAGQTWTNVAAAQGAQVFLEFSATAGVAYYPQFSFPGPSPMIRTADAGQTWTSLGAPIPGGVHRAEVLDAQTAVVVTPVGQVWRTTDAGQTWTFAFAAPTVGCDRIAAECEWGLDFSSTTEGWLVATNGLVLRTTDGGLTWTQVSNGYGVGSDIAMFDEHRLLVASSEALLTEDAGARWVLIEDAVEPAGNLAVQTLNDSVAVMLTGANSVQRTFDGGHTWTAGNPIPDPGFSVGDNGDVHFRTPTDGWVVGRDLISPYDRNVWHTPDGGQTWTSLAGTPGTRGQVWVGVDFEGQRGWIVSGVQLGGGIGARVLRTEDGGATWTFIELPDSYAYNMNDIEFFDENTGYVVGWFGYAARSTDGGATWTVLNVPPAPPGSPSPGYTMWDIHVTSPNDVWVATTEDVVLHSTDGGATWQELTVNSRPEAFGSFTGVVATPGGSAWVVGFGGHIYALNPPVATEPTIPVPAAGLALSAPVPNPARSAVRFTLALAAAQRVTITAYDALGRRVAVLHEGPMAAGTHALALDVSALAPGVYVVRADGPNGGSASRRLVVTR